MMTGSIGTLKNTVCDNLMSNFVSGREMSVEMNIVYYLNIFIN